MSEYKRLPNGFGQISRIKRNLAKPYRAMVSVGGKNKLLRPVGYFSKYQEAYDALEHSTFGYLLESFLENSPPGKMANWKVVLPLCEPILRISAASITVEKIEPLLDRDLPPAILYRLKILIQAVLDLAMERNIIEENPARSISLDNYSRSSYYTDA